MKTKLLAIIAVLFWALPGHSQTVEGTEAIVEYSGGIDTTSSPGSSRSPWRYDRDGDALYRYDFSLSRWVLYSTGSGGGDVTTAQLADSTAAVRADFPAGGTTSIFKEENSTTDATAGTTNNYHAGSLGIGDFSNNTIGAGLHLYGQSNATIRLSDSTSTDSSALAYLDYYRGHTASNLGRIGYTNLLDADLYVTNKVSGGSVKLGTENVTNFELLPSGQVVLPQYDNTSTITGTKHKLLALTSAGEVIPVDTVVSGGSGEINTASNLGAGTGVFAQKNSLDLEFKSLVAGAGISLANDASTVTITATGGGGGTPAGSDGQMQYNNGGAFGGSSVYWDDTNDYLGVGESSPDKAIHVTGDWPTLKMEDGSSGLGIHGRFQHIGGATWLTSNVDTATTSTFVLDNTSFPGVAVTPRPGSGGVEFWAASAGTNPRSPSMIFDVNIDQTAGFYLTGALQLPRGTTAQRPTGLTNGWIRQNTSTSNIEYYDGSSSWWPIQTVYSSTFSGTTDGSGDLTVTHFFTTTPDGMTVSPSGTTPYILTVHSCNTSTCKVRVFDTSGTAVTSTAVDINWTATR